MQGIDCVVLIVKNIFDSITLSIGMDMVCVLHAWLEHIVHIVVAYSSTCM